MKYQISIFGAPIKSDNLGCVALTYSLIDLLEEIARNNNISFQYYIFEPNSSKKQEKYAENKLGLDLGTLHSKRIGGFYTLPQRVKHILDNKTMKKIVKNSSIVIDLTEGDSFTDIYGQDRFEIYTLIKRFIENNNGKFIIGSQTLGPFNKKANYKQAVCVIENSFCTIARDKLSKQYMQNNVNKDIYLTADIAFRLKFCKNRQGDSKVRKAIGINISGLLTANKTESTERKFSLLTDYDCLINELLEYLINRGDEVYLLTHVKDDYEISALYHQKYQETILVPFFSDPIDAKSFISSLDILIGSRMHAMIAALTCGVPSIPLAYSRKFKGVFELVGYKYVIDLQKETTQRALELLKSYIEHYEDLVKNESSALIESKKEIDSTYTTYENVILQALGIKTG